MKFVIHIVSIIMLSGLAPAPALAQDGGKAPEPKTRVEIVRQPKTDSRERETEPSKGDHREGNGDRNHSRGDRDKPQQWVGA